MTNDQDDSDLKRLFERSGEEPSSFALTRMAARARELPERLERVPRHLPRWAWAPAFAGIAALGALVLVLLSTTEPGVAPTAPTLAPRAASAPVTRSSAPLPSSSRAQDRGDDAIPLDDDPALDPLGWAIETDDDLFDLLPSEVDVDALPNLDPDVDRKETPL